MKDKKKLILPIIGLVCIITSFICLMILTAPTLGEKRIKFESTYKEETVLLDARVNMVEGSEYCVIICPGFSCDKQKWRPFTDLFISNNISTFRFDYSGQGASYSTIGFDNAKTDHIPTEISDAMDYVANTYGYSYEKIILVGHSMGGRAILRLLHNVATGVEGFNHRPGNVILMSPEVNYNFNAQASLFAGTSDAEDPLWKNYNESYMLGTNLYLFGSTADDIVSDEDVIQIFKHCGGKLDQTSGKVELTTNTLSDSTTKVTVGVTSGTLHSYIMYSARFGKYVNTSLKMIMGKDMTYNANKFKLVYAGWFTALIGIFLIMFSLSKNEKWEKPDEIPTLTNVKKFLGWKMFCWLPALVVMFLICCISVVMPFGSPVMNIMFMGSIAGYGITMLIAYRKGKFPGMDGKLPKLSFKVTNKKWYMACIVTILLSVFVWFVYRTSMYDLIPLNFRWIYLIFATIVMSIGYYVSGVENDALDRSNATKLQRVIYNLISYVPLFLLTVGYLILASYSGLIGQVQNMVIMYILCIPVGDYVKKKTNNRIYGALVTAFLFQASMITSTALIALF